MFQEELMKLTAHLNNLPRSQQNNLQDHQDHDQDQNSRNGEQSNNQMLAESIELLSRTLAMTLNRKKSVRFNDVEKTFREFTGSSHSNFNTWLIHFGEQSLLYDLNSTEKFIFCKRLMTKEAKLFLDFESKARNYQELILELTNEFGQNINSALIHQRLRERKKKNDENFTEYFYEMLSLASHTNIDKAAIITYTIEGLPGSIESKAFMYEAQTVGQFKKKLQAFELINSKEFHQKKTETNQEERKKCYNCGELHNTPECPNKERGPKCFVCNEWGHRSSNHLTKKPEEEPKINFMRQSIDDSEKETTGDEQPETKRPNRMLMIRKPNADNKKTQDQNFVQVSNEILQKQIIELNFKFGELQSKLTLTEQKYEEKHNQLEKLMNEFTKEKNLNEILKTKLQDKNEFIERMTDEKTDDEMKSTLMTKSTTNEINTMKNQKIAKNFRFVLPNKCIKDDFDKILAPIKRNSFKSIDKINYSAKEMEKKENENQNHPPDHERVKMSKKEFFYLMNNFKKTGEDKDDCSMKKDGRDVGL